MVLIGSLLVLVVKYFVEALLILVLLAYPTFQFVVFVLFGLEDGEDDSHRLEME